MSDPQRTECVACGVEFILWEPAPLLKRKCPDCKKADVLASWGLPRDFTTRSFFG